MSFYSTNDYFLFLRAQVVSAKYWLVDNSSQLAKQKLSADAGECSVYKVSSYEEELWIAAEHYPTLDRKYVDKIFGLRLEKDFLDSFKFDLVATIGGTGFLPLDQKHFDIKGSLDQFINMAEGISKKIQAGSDIFRTFESLVLANKMREFIDTNPQEMKQSYKDKITKCLSNIK